jgi:hypothetical protein
MNFPFQATSPSQSHPYPPVSRLTPVPTERNHATSTLKSSLFTLLLAPFVLGATMPGSASASPAHRPVTLLATQEGHTIQVIGSHFTPGATVTIALLNTHTWHVLSTGSTRSEAAVYGCPLEVNLVCGRRDPTAGRLYFQTTLHQRVSSSALAVLYRSGNQIGFEHVQ